MFLIVRIKYHVYVYMSLPCISFSFIQCKCINGYPNANIGTRWVGTYLNIFPSKHKIPVSFQ